MHENRIGSGDPREIPFRLECLERGGHLLYRAERLLLRLIYDWPRRDRRMLLTGCGAGLFLETMHKAGFEVSGQDSHPHFVTRARLKLGHDVDLHLGSSDRLQFGDNAFDYVAVLLTLNLTSDPEAVLQEAYRVGSKGMLLGVLNRCPKPTQQEAARLGIDMKKKDPCVRLPWYRLKKMLREGIPYEALLARSVLPGPQGTWKETPWADCLNCLDYPPDWGAFYAVRTDLQTEFAGLPLRALGTKPEIV